MDALTATLHGRCERSNALHAHHGNNVVVGFTLIEILVVLAIVSVMLLAVGLSVDSGGPARRVVVEAQRLAALMQLACDESSQFGQDVGVRFEAQGYAFVRAVGREWQPRSTDALRARKLPAGMRIDLEIGQRRIDLEAEPEPPTDDTTATVVAQADDPNREEPNPRGLVPHLACDADGKLTASDARVVIHAGDRSAGLAAGDDGMLHVAGDDGTIRMADANPPR